MPIVLPPSHLRVAFHHSAPGATGDIVNTETFDCTTSTFSGQVNLDKVAQAWGSNIQALHASGVGFTHASAMWHDPILGEQALDTVLGAVGGSGSAPIMPLNVAVIIEKRTAFAGRKFRGRWFFGGFSLGSMNSSQPNIISAAFKTSLQSACDLFKSQLDGDNILGVLQHPVGGPTPTLITHYSVKDLVGNMRKRIR